MRSRALSSDSISWSPKFSGDWKLKKSFDLLKKIVIHKYDQEIESLNNEKFYRHIFDHEIESL